jgi:uncharacterized protein (DUF58 family)
LADQQPGLRPVRVTWLASEHARRLLTLAVAGLALAILTRRPEFAGLAAPALMLLATWRPDRPAEIALRIDSPSVRIMEDDEVPVSVELRAAEGYATEFRIRPAPDFTAGPGVALPAAAESDLMSVRLSFRPERWGRRRPGTVEVTLRDRARLAEGKVLVELATAECAPLPASLTSSILLSRLPSRLGEHPARAIGDGGEFDGVREFVPGDRQRRINWPATTRHGTLHLTTFAAERTQNVVVVADISFDVGPAGRTTQDLVLRGAAGVITRYAASRDRVGLISVGAKLGWVSPGQGRRQVDRLMELLVRGPVLSRPADALSRLPRPALPPGALIVAFSPLLDPRFIEIVRELRERGFSVLVLDVLASVPQHDASAVSALTARLWQLERDAMRFSLAQIGVPVAHWDGHGGLDEPLAPYLRRRIVVQR